MTSDFTIAVHALVFLNHKQKQQSSEAISDNVCANPVRIRKVMSQLKKAGLVEAKGGTEGGYFFAKNPSEVSLNAVAGALKIDFVANSWKTGDPHMACLIASGMNEIMKDIYARMNQACIAYLGQISIADLDYTIFCDGMRQKE